MFFKIYLAIMSVAIVVGCILAIVMSTSHGMAWVERTWRRRAEAPAAERDDETN